MTKEQKEEIERLIVAAGYEEQLKDILLIEDLEPLEIESNDYDITPIETEELYWY